VSIGCQLDTMSDESVGRRLLVASRPRHIAVPYELHRLLRIRAAEDGKKLQEVVLPALWALVVSSEAVESGVAA
jgi:hypothetical protein